MSFILDALKKSETERQEQSAAEFSSVPVSSDSPNPARWLWLLAALLLVNVAILLGILLKPGDNPASPAVKATVEEVAEPRSARSFEDQVANVMTARPPARQVAQPEPPVSNSPATTTAAAPRHAPTLDQLRLNGSLNLPELHLDIHVFSENPADRFVFINMNKHREGARIESGPVIKEITADGVILEHQGQTFLLPRE